MRLVLRYIYKPKPQPILEEVVTARSIEEAKAEAKHRLDEKALTIAPPPDGVIIIDADTHEMIDIIERRVH